MNMNENMHAEEMQDIQNKREGELRLADRVDEAIKRFSDECPRISENFATAIENGNYEEAEQLLETLLIQSKALGNTMHGKLDEFREITGGGQTQKIDEAEKLAG